MHPDSNDQSSFPSDLFAIKDWQVIVAANRRVALVEKEGGKSIAVKVESYISQSFGKSLPGYLKMGTGGGTDRKRRA